MCGKHTYDYIKTRVEDIGWTLMSKIYKKATDYLEFKCMNNHIFTNTWNEINAHAICRECLGKNPRITYEFVKKTIEEFGWRLVSKEYKNANTKLECICDNGHELKIKWA